MWTQSRSTSRKIAAPTAEREKILMKTKLAPETITQMVAMAKNGLPVEEIAKSLECGLSTTYRYLQMAGVTGRKGNRCKDDMAELRNEGFSNAEIAKRCGVCLQTVYTAIGCQPSSMSRLNHKTGLAMWSMRVQTRKRNHEAMLIENANKKIAFFNARVERQRQLQAELEQRKIAMALEIENLQRQIAHAEDEVNALVEEAHESAKIATIEMVAY